MSLCVRGGESQTYVAHSWNRTVREHSVPQPFRSPTSPLSQSPDPLRGLALVGYGSPASRPSSPLPACPHSPFSPTCWVARLCHNHMKSHFPGVSPHLGKPAESPARPRPAAGTPGEINAAGGASPPCSNQGRAPSAGDRAQYQPWSSQAQPVTHRSRSHRVRATSSTQATPPESLPSSVSPASRSLKPPVVLRADEIKDRGHPWPDRGWGRKLVSCGELGYQLLTL